MLFSNKLAFIKEIYIYIRSKKVNKVHDKSKYIIDIGKGKEGT